MCSFMTYLETIKYLESFINYEKIPVYPYKESLKLERIHEFLATIDNPQDALKCIHIAGSKGKGSTCAFLTYILRQTGFKVGLYTSPHLSDFRERIRILSVQQPTMSSSPQCPAEDFEGMITEDELIDLVERLKTPVERYNRSSEYGPLSFFEVYTALAFIYFKEKKVDFVVLETGLGGRLDATNVINPYVCAISPISYEHTQKLGNTLREIATEKAGIIKSSPQSTMSSSPQLIVISAPQEKEVQEVIRSRCKEVGAKLYEVNPVRNIAYAKRDNKISNGVNKDIFYETQDDIFNVMGVFGEYPCLKIRLMGEHQLINACVAIGAIEALQFYNINVDIDSIRDGLYNTVWPGRCEVVSKEPLVILDGAQNVASTQALKQAIKENFSAGGGSAFGGKYKKLILVLGISNDKDVKGICNELRDLTDEVILTKASNPRASKPQDLAKYFNGKDVYTTNNVNEAKAKVLDIANKEDLILVTGSLFVVGEARELFYSFASARCPDVTSGLMCAPAKTIKF